MFRTGYLNSILNKWLIILCSSICLLSCKPSRHKKPAPQNNNEDSITSKGQILIKFNGNANDENKGWSYYDNVQNQKHSWNESNTISVLNWESDFLLSYATLPAPLTSYYPIQPGDSITITNKNYPNYPVIELSNNRFSSFELNFPAFLASKNKSVFEFGIRKLMPTKDFPLKGTLKDYYNNSLQLIDSCFKEGLIRKEYRNWIQKAVKYEYFDQLIWTSKSIDSSSFKKIFELQDLNNGLYRRLLKQYFLKIDMGGTNDYQRGFLLINNLYKGANRDFLLTVCLIEILKNPESDRKKFLALFNQECKTEKYKNYIYKNYALKEDDQVLRDVLSDADKRKFTLDSLLNSYKGKLVYIDVWASWCSPCRFEMPYSSKLRQEYKDKAIVFLFLSTDDNFGDWVDAGKQEHLTQNSFLLTDWRHTRFNDENDISTIPRYILLNKKGQIINKNAPRPSDPNLKTVFEKYLVE